MPVGNSTGVTSNQSLYPIKFADDRRAEHLTVKVDTQQKAVGPNNGENSLQAEVVMLHSPFRAYPTTPGGNHQGVVVGSLVNVRA
jgi:hypothetical protein